MSHYTDDEKARCAEKEVSMRRRVYARLVHEGRMKADDAARELALMREIAQDYKERAHATLPGL